MNTASRLLLVVLAILGYQDATAQADASGGCCPPGYIAGELFGRFEPGTSRDRAEEIAVEFGFQVTRFVDRPSGPLYVLCVPLGKESAFITMLEPLPEVQFATLNGVICGAFTTCECCPCGFVCEAPAFPGYPPCDPECEPDADGDNFADSCDTCTDADDDGFGDPEFGYDVFGNLIRTCPIDNCPDAVNPDQADLDGDGIGDECDRRLRICHRSPGKPSGAHTITIALRAYPAHLAHGDIPGACAVKR